MINEVLHWVIFEHIKTRATPNVNMNDNFSWLKYYLVYVKVTVDSDRNLAPRH